MQNHCAFYFYNTCSPGLAFMLFKQNKKKTIKIPISPSPDTTFFETNGEIYSNS